MLPLNLLLHILKDIQAISVAQNVQSKVFIATRICFPKFDCQKRTDISFYNQIQEEDHLGHSILLDIQNFGIVSQTPLDYMHMICIGVVKQLRKLWISGPLKTNFAKDTKCF